MIAPIYKDLSTQHENLTFAKVDIDLNAAAASDASIKVRGVESRLLIPPPIWRHRITKSYPRSLPAQSVPTFMFFKEGAFAGQFAGELALLTTATTESRKITIAPPRIQVLTTSCSRLQWRS